MNKQENLENGKQITSLTDLELTIEQEEETKAGNGKAVQITSIKLEH
jgi:hypothetical protein